MNRKPTSVLEASGAFKKDPQRRADRALEPSEFELLKPGVEVPCEVKALGAEDYYNQILEVAHEGSVAKADRFIVVIAATLYRQFVTDFNTMKSSDIQALIKALSELGLSPIQRTRLQVTPKPKKNAFSDL